MITTYNQITQLDCEKDNECDSLCSCQTDEPLYDKKITDDQMNIEYTTECSECESVVSCCNEYIANNESTDDIIADHEDNNDDEQKNNNRKLDSSYDSYELEMLLKNDELDLNRKLYYSNEETKIEFNASNNNNSRPLIRKDQDSKIGSDLESKKLTTLPIERPHSNVPVTNIEKFEAYLDKYAIENNKIKEDNNKLKIILPGINILNITAFKLKYFSSLVDITKASKYSRKSNPFIWLQFCENGLKSPKILRKRAKSCFPSLNPQLFFNPDIDAIYNNDDDDPKASPGNLTPITPLKNVDLDNDGDIFNDHFQSKSFVTNVKQKYKFVDNKNRSSYECNCSCATTTTATSPSITLTTNTNLISVTTTCSETNVCSEVFIFFYYFILKNNYHF